MEDRRQSILGWAEQGRIAPGNLRQALETGGALPSRADWRRFLDRLLLWMGTALAAAGVLFFLAANWQRLGRFAKFGLVEALLAVALLFVWRLGVDRPAGKAALFAAALLTGGLLALIGQTYQTGADTFELFATWAALILPWVLAGRFPALWLFWLALVNLALALYYQARPDLFGALFATERLLWALFALNTAALAAWEAAAAAGVPWLRERWGARLIATASGTIVTALALYGIFDGEGFAGWGLAGWIAWLAALYGIYRRRVRDIYIAAGGVLSVIVVVTALLGEHLIDSAFGWLFLALVVIGLSALGAMWLRTLTSEVEA